MALHETGYLLRRVFLADCGQIFARAYNKLADDGTAYGPGNAVVTPSVIRAELIALMRELEEKGLVENVETFKEQLIVERNADDRNRVDVLAPPDLVNQFRIFACLTRFVL